jgi:hypothetical protein
VPGEAWGGSEERCANAQDGGRSKRIHVAILEGMQKKERIRGRSPRHGSESFASSLLHWAGSMDLLWNRDVICGGLGSELRAFSRAMQGSASRCKIPADLNIIGSETMYTPYVGLLRSNSAELLTGPPTLRI